MHAAYLIVVVLTAAANLYAGIADFARPQWLLTTIKRQRIEERWLPTLGILKILGSVGLLAGIASPQIGIAAAAGLVVYFFGAIVTVLRARWYSNLPFPLVWFAMAMGAFVLRLYTA